MRIASKIILLALRSWGPLRRLVCFTPESCRSWARKDPAARCQEQTSHTDNVGRLRETTLRRSLLRYASDWRQDIDTAPAALRMTSSTRNNSAHGPKI